MNSALKSIVRRLRAKPYRKTPLCHLLINIRSANGAPRWTNHQLKTALSGRELEWEYGKRNMVIDRFKDACFESFVPRPKKGRRTHFFEGKYYSYNPIDDSLPF